MSEIRCVSFPNSHGQVLHGILHHPDPSVARGVCVVLLSPGIKGRVGPHRLYLKIAARLMPLGFHVLRFDFHGLGDSEGTLPERRIADMYNAIQNGRYVDDTVAAMDWVQTTCGIQRFVGSGLCGGSISALLTAAQDYRIECLLFIGLPTALEGGRENWAKYATQGYLDRVRRGYFLRLRSFASWRRLLLGKSEYSVIWKAIRNVVMPRARTESPVANETASEEDNTNPLFAPAFRAVAESGRPSILFYGGNDKLQFEFAEKFEARNAQWLKDGPRPYRVQIIPDANHVMSDGPWVQALLDGAESWLNERFPE